MRFPAWMLTALMLSASLAWGQSSADELLKRGENHGQAGEYDLAIQDFTEALRLKPNYPDALYDRAYTYIRKRDFDHAIQDLNEAIRLKPDYAEAFYNRSTAYMAKGDYDQGMQDYLEAVRLNPDLVKRYGPANSSGATGGGPPSIASAVKAETGFVSEHRYSNAFFGFEVTWPEDEFLRYREPEQRMADLLCRIPFRHVLFVAGGEVTVVIFADEAPGATFNDAKEALGHESDFDLKSIRIGGKQFWKREYGLGDAIRYATALNGYILQINLDFTTYAKGELQKKFVASVENLTFIDPAKAKEVAGPDSWPALTQPPGWDSGIVSGNTFTHPLLHFSYEFPAGWHVGDRTKAEKLLDAGRTGPQYWNEEIRKDFPEEHCPFTLLALTRFPEEAAGSGTNSRIFLIAFHPTPCLPSFPAPKWLGDPAKSDAIAQLIEDAFQGVPFIATSNKKVSSYSVDGHFMLEISGVSSVNVPGEKTPVELHTAFILSPLEYEWLGWGLVAGSEAELQELRKIHFKLRQPAPVVAWENRPQGSAAELNDQGLEKYNKNDFESAIQDFNQAIRLKPDFAAAFYNRGTAFRRMNDWEHAIQDCAEAVRLRPDYAEAFLCRAIAYANQRDPDLALKDVSEAIRIKPDYADAFNLRGSLDTQKGDYNRAIQDYSDAIRVKPDFAAGFYQRGNTYRYPKRDYDHAIQDYTEVIRLKPDWVGNAFLARGYTCEEKGDYHCAIRDLSEAIRLKPADARMFLNRGKDYAHTGDLDHAIEDFTEAIRLKPDQRWAFYERGLAYDQKKDYDHAVQDFTQAIRIDPSYGQAFYERGIARRQRGEKLNAIDDFSEAGRLDPSLLQQAGQQIEEIQKQK